MSAPNLVVLTPSDNVEARTRALLRVDECLQALLETEEMVPDEQEAEYWAAVAQAVSASETERDRYNEWLVRVEGKISAVAGEIQNLDKEWDRLKARKERYEGILDKGEQFVVKLITSLQPDRKGKYPKLEGRTVTFSVRRNPDSVDDAIDDTKLPAKYKRAELTLPALLLEEILDSLEMDLREKVLAAIKTKYEVSKSAIKEDLTATPPVEVPGAKLAEKSYRLVRS